jgi:hypothetical protein
MRFGDDRCHSGRRNQPSRPSERFLQQRQSAVEGAKLLWDAHAADIGGKAFQAIALTGGQYHYPGIALSIHAYAPSWFTFLKIDANLVPKSKRKKM